MGEPIGATDPNEEFIKVDESTVTFFSRMLAREKDALNKVRSSIITTKETITRLSNQVTRDEQRVKQGERKVAVWEFALVKAKALGELTNKVEQ